MTSYYKILYRSSEQKTNPIQTQLKPKQTQFKPIQTQFKPNQTQFFQRQTGPITEQIIWSHNVSGPFEHLSGQYLHLMDSVLILLVEENTSQLFIQGRLFFRKKRHLAHKFLKGGNAMKKRKTNDSKLWAIGVMMAIVLLAAPSAWAMFTYEGTGEYNLETDLVDDLQILDGQIVNLHATVEGYIQAHPGSVLKIYSGSVFWYIIISAGEPKPAQVSVYGTDFVVDKIPTTATEFTPKLGEGSVLEGFYGTSDPIEPTWLQDGLWFFSDNIPIKLLPPEYDVPEITIDIKPGSDENVINLKSKGVVPVAVLTTDDFDAGTLVPDYSILFAGASPVHTTLCDVDEDGDMDMLFHFRTQQLVELKEDSKSAMLTATLTSAVTRSSAVTAVTAGDVIQGTDKVKIKSSRKK